MKESGGRSKSLPDLPQVGENNENPLRAAMSRNCEKGLSEQGRGPQVGPSEMANPLQRKGKNVDKHRREAEGGGGEKSNQELASIRRLHCH